MTRSRKKKKTPKRVLALRDLEQAKSPSEHPYIEERPAHLR